jgi:hypothetical protein
MESGGAVWHTSAEKRVRISPMFDMLARKGTWDVTGLSVNEQNAHLFPLSLLPALHPLPPFLPKSPITTPSFKLDTST